MQHGLSEILIWASTKNLIWKFEGKASKSDRNGDLNKRKKRAGNITRTEVLTKEALLVFPAIVYSNRHLATVCPFSALSISCQKYSPFLTNFKIDF